MLGDAFGLPWSTIKLIPPGVGVSSGIAKGVGEGQGVSVGFNVGVGLGSSVGAGVQVGGRLIRGVFVAVGLTANKGKGALSGGKGFKPTFGFMKMRRKTPATKRTNRSTTTVRIFQINPDTSFGGGAGLVST